VANEPRLAVESIAGQRPYQEDSVLAESLPDGRVLVAVADGMGGHAAGEVASALALETLVAALRDGQPLDAAFTMANARVHEKAEEPGKQGMGTTLVAALIEEGEYMIANVGDSRGYLLSGEGIRQLTEDHSFVAEAMKRGQTEAEAMATPWKDALTRSIGTEEHVDVDVFGPFPVADDTALLICSDGLYKALGDDDLRRIFSHSGGARGAAQSLVSSAFENGSDDNISVVIAEYGEVPREALQGTMPIAYHPDAEAGPGAVDAGAPDEDAASEEETLVDGRTVGFGGSEGDVGTMSEVGTAVSDTTDEVATPVGSGLPIGMIATVVAVVGLVIALLVLLG
jgi:PPM family protein phosphatase